MRPVWVAVIVALAVSSLTLAQSVEQLLRKAENDVFDATIKKDYAALDRLLADDFASYGDPDDSVGTKAQLIADLKSGDSVLTSYKYSDMKVRVFSDSAFISGLQTLKQTYKGKDTSGTFRFTDTLVKRGNSWQFIAEHSTKIEKPKK